MYTWIVDVCLPSIGNVVAYVLSIAEMPEIALEYLLKGNTFDWFALNFATGELVPCKFYSYDVLTDIISRVPGVGGIIAEISEWVLDGAGQVIYNLIFKTSAYSTNPMWFALIIGVFKLSIIVFVVKFLVRLFI